MLPSEKNYLNYLKLAKVQLLKKVTSLNEYEFPDSKLANISEQFEKLIERNYYLNRTAFEGYKTYLMAYSSHALKDVFDINKLDLAKVARAFGFTVPPRVNLSNFNNFRC